MPDTASPTTTASANTCTAIATPSRSRLSGDVITTEGVSEQGMVMDFSDVKHIAKQHVVDAWDHAFLVYRGDKVVLDFLNTLPGHKTVVLDVIPTAENLAKVAFDLLQDAYHDTYGNHLRLERVRLYETPNNWADYPG